jgi:hypothetical protein
LIAKKELTKVCSSVNIGQTMKEILTLQAKKIRKYLYKAKFDFNFERGNCFYVTTETSTE